MIEFSFNNFPVSICGPKRYSYKNNEEISSSLTITAMHWWIIKYQWHVMGLIRPNSPCQRILNNKYLVRTTIQITWTTLFAHSQVRRSPGCSSSSQNKMVGLVVSTSWPDSPRHGANDVPASNRHCEIHHFLFTNTVQFYYMWQYSNIRPKEYIFWPLKIKNE